MEPYLCDTRRRRRRKGQKEGGTEGRKEQGREGGKGKEECKEGRKQGEGKGEQTQLLPLFVSSSGSHPSLKASSSSAVLLHTE